MILELTKELEEALEPIKLSKLIQVVKPKLIELQEQCYKLGLNITIANVELQITNLIKLRISICYVRHWIDYKFTYNNSTVELTYINNDWNINVRV